MKKLFEIFLGLAFFFTSIFTASAAFSDVPTDHQYGADIQYLEQLGIVHEDTFQPDSPITREVFAKWLLKNAGFIGEQYKRKNKRLLIDVKRKENPYAPYIYRLVDLGLLESEDGKKINTFHPKKTLGRREALEWIFFVEGISVPKIFDENQFQAKDVKIGSKNAPLIHKAIQLGMLAPGKVKPAKKLTRAEAAHFLKIAKNQGVTLTVTILPTVDSDFVRNPKYDILLGAWNKILQSYLRKDQVQRDNLVYGAVDGMVKELGDKNSDFERPGDNALLDSLSGAVEGIGAVVQKKDDDIVVVAPLAGSPAEKAGLLPNDIIIKVDDVTVKGMKLDAVVARIKGKKGTQVKLDIKRNGKSLVFTITRDVVKIVSASMKRTDDNIAIISLRDFGRNVDFEFGDVVTQIQENKPKAIIIDLRNNPGGFLDKSITIAGHFIKNGEKVASVRYPDHEQMYTSSGDSALAEYKIILIANAGTASASEILAGALQDHSLAKVVGEKTFGKGTVQELSDFTDGSTLKLTVAEWLTPKGRTIEKDGITPDIEVKLTDEDRTAGRDPQMDRALEELRK